jgi:hypothetical protein
VLCLQRLAYAPVHPAPVKPAANSAAVWAWRARSRTAMASSSSSSSAAAPPAGGSSAGGLPRELAAQVHYCVDTVVRGVEDGDAGGRPLLDTGARYLLGKLAIDYARVIAQDAAAFARHRGRAGVDASDVALVGRRDPHVAARLAQLRGALEADAARAKAAAAAAKEAAAASITAGGGGGGGVDGAPPKKGGPSANGSKKRKPQQQEHQLEAAAAGAGDGGGEEAT